LQIDHEQKPSPTVLTKGQLTRANAVAVMCDKCIELDKKLEQYRRIASSITDELTVARLNKLIKDTVAQKAALHPDQEQ
jgi:fructose-specific phosphotransferase system component IIB